MKKLLLATVLSAFVFTGCNILPNSTPVSSSSSQNPTLISSPSSSPEVIYASPSPETTMDKPTENSMAKDKQYTLSDISTHNNKNDCWFAINGSVYNVTSYIAQGVHPGGEKILLGCGKDATQLYSTKAGKGQDHSDMAKAYLAQFKIGVLVQ